MSLEVDIRHSQGAFTLHAKFRSDGRLTALFGRSGAGKTTLINAIGGLVRPSEGRVVVNGRVLLDTARNIDVPIHKRRIGYVFQEGRLFPHLTVRQNLLFGRWFTPRERRAASPEDVIALLGIEHLLARRPLTLSGGEKQRIAIGRALLAEPDLLVMDEPLASLDESRKEEILPYIERLRDDGRVPIVLVSHSIPEIARLATSVIVLSEGSVVAAGQADAILRHASLFPQLGPAEAGALVETRVLMHDEPFALTVLESRAGALTVPRVSLPIGAPLRVRIRARDVILSLEPPGRMSALNVLAGRVVLLEETGNSVVDVTLVCGGVDLVARITRKSAELLSLAVGSQVHAIIKSVAFDSEATARAPREDGA